MSGDYKTIELENIRKVALLLEAPNGETKKIPVNFKPTVSKNSIGKVILRYDKINNSLIFY